MYVLLVVTTFPSQIDNNNNNNNRLVPTKGALSQREALDTIDPQTGSADVLPWNKFQIQQV
jgi:hypothetical protein